MKLNLLYSKNMKKYWVIILVFLISDNLFAQTNIKKLEPEKYFDFWVGEWDLIWQTVNSKTGEGKNYISKKLNDHVIEENFKVINDDNMKGFVGKSWSVYNKNNQTWYQTWVDNQGSYLDFVGEIDGNKRIFKREFTLSNGRLVKQRMVFYNIKENSFTWDWESSMDNGKSWDLKWRIFYSRKK